MTIFFHGSGIRSSIWSIRLVLGWSAGWWTFLQPMQDNNNRLMSAILDGKETLLRIMLLFVLMYKYEPLSREGRQGGGYFYRIGTIDPAKCSSLRARAKLKLNPNSPISLPTENINFLTY